MSDAIQVRTLRREFLGTQFVLQLDAPSAEVDVLWVLEGVSTKGFDVDDRVVGAVGSGEVDLELKPTWYREGRVSKQRGRAAGSLRRLLSWLLGIDALLSVASHNLNAYELVTKSYWSLNPEGAPCGRLETSAIKFVGGSLYAERAVEQFCARHGCTQAQLQEQLGTSPSEHTLLSVRASYAAETGSPATRLRVEVDLTGQAPSPRTRSTAGVAHAVVVQGGKLHTARVELPTPATTVEQEAAASVEEHGGATA